MTLSARSVFSNLTGLYDGESSLGAWPARRAAATPVLTHRPVTRAPFPTEPGTQSGTLGP